MEGGRRALCVGVVMLLCAGCSGAGSPAGTSDPSGRSSSASAAASAPSSTAPRKALAGRVVVIDPGHNGGNSGSPGVVNRQVDAGFGQRKACNTSGTETVSGYPEHAFAWDVSRHMARALRALGAKVVLTRTTDTGAGPCVDRRGTAGQRAGADLMVSVHADGTADGSGRGFYVIHAPRMEGGSGVATKSRALAVSVRDAVARGTGMPKAHGGSGLSERHDLGTLNLATVPTVMIESGNMRNPTDARLLTDAAFRKRQGRALAAGVRTFLAPSSGGGSGGDVARNH